MKKKATIIFIISLFLLSIILVPVLSLITRYATVNLHGTITPASQGQALHIADNRVLNQNNNTVRLRGVDYTYLIDNPSGSWMLQTGSIAWNNWDMSIVNDNLDAMKEWGCNTIRVLATVEWWMNPAYSEIFQNHIKDLIDAARMRDMYIVFTFWRVNGSSSQESLPYPQSSANNGYINNQQDFVGLWTDVTRALKIYPNVLFELWNEPTGSSSNQEEWFNTVQQCITSIRGAGATNLIVVQWGYCVGVDFAGFNNLNSGLQTDSLWSVDWINQYPLNDPLSNILYSAHIYRNSFYDSGQGYKQVGSPSWINRTSNDIAWALNVTGITTINKPLWIGEIGCSLWATDMPNEYIWFNSTLAILNQNKIGYSVWAWPPWGPGTQWSIVNGQSNYAPNRVGQILIQNLAEEYP